MFGVIFVHNPRLMSFLFIFGTKLDAFNLQSTRVEVLMPHSTQRIYMGLNQIMRKQSFLYMDKENGISRESTSFGRKKAIHLTMPPLCALVRGCNNHTSQRICWVWELARPSSQTSNSSN